MKPDGLTAKNKFDLFDHAAKSSYLMYVFSLGVINEQSLFIQGGYSNFFEYTLDRFELKEKSTYRYLQVYNRLKNYILTNNHTSQESLSSQLSPDAVEASVRNHPLADIPLQKLYIISQLTDTKLRNLLTKGEVILGNNQKFSLEKLKKLDRNRLLELIAEPKKPKTKKVPVEINIDDVQISEIHAVEIYSAIESLMVQISNSRLTPGLKHLYDSTLSTPLKNFSYELLNHFKKDIQ